MSQTDVLIEQVAQLTKAFEKHEEKMDIYIKATEERLRALEDWRLKFIAKFSVYSSIAIFLGSIFGSILTKVVFNWLA